MIRWNQIREAYRVRPGYWFAPKLFGYGATPVTWQGWASVAVLLALALAIVSQVGEAPVLLALLAPLFLGYIQLAHAKTDGEWHWRWGPRDEG